MEDESKIPTSVAESKSPTLPERTRKGWDFGPKSSVVDKYHRTHDVPNSSLSMAEASSLADATSPACTIQALAYRAADHITRAAKAGDIQTATQQSTAEAPACI